MDIHEKTYQMLRKEGYAGWGGEHYARRRDGWKQTLDTLLPLIEREADVRDVLELGCGNGMGSRFLIKRGYSFHGIDISAEAIDWAKAEFKKEGLPGDFRVGDVSDLSVYQTAAFDLVVDAACLHCITGNKREQVWSEIRRITKFGGFLIVSAMCQPLGAEIGDLEFDPERSVLLQDGLPYRFLPELSVLQEELQTNGFKIVFEQVQARPWWSHFTCVARKS